MDVHHPLLNMGTKSTHFINDGMIVWSQLESLNFNLQSDFKQKTNELGNGYFDTAFSKVTNHLSAKPTKFSKSREKIIKVMAHSI